MRMLLLLCVVGQAPTCGNAGTVLFQELYPLRTADLQPATRDRYARALSSFLRWTRQSALHPVTHEEYDDALELYINDCYVKWGGRFKQRLVDTVCAMLRRWPRLGGKLGCSTKALRSWDKVIPSKSYAPLTWDVVLLIAEIMDMHGWG